MCLICLSLAISPAHGFPPCIRIFLSDLGGGRFAQTELGMRRYRSDFIPKCASEP